MAELGKTSRNAALVLILVALIIPYEMEVEWSGPLDARLFRRLISGMVWAIETNGFQSMIGSWETTELFFPYCCLSEFAIFLLLINLLLVFLIVLSLDGLIDHRITVRILIFSAILPPVLSALLGGEIWVIPIPAVHLLGLFLLRNSRQIGQ